MIGGLIGFYILHLIVRKAVKDGIGRSETTQLLKKVHREDDVEIFKTRSDNLSSFDKMMKKDLDHE